MSGVVGIFGVLGIVILFMVGLAFLIPGIVGTAITSKVKHGPKASRVLSTIALVIGIVLCALSVLIAVIAIASML